MKKEKKDYPIQKISKSTFPLLLSEIPDPPTELWLRGELPPPDNKLLCVVGSRKYSTYGKNVCEKFIKELAGYPVSIVSGLAHGIDSIAHRSALESGLHTIAVPGSGIDPSVIYPRTHRSLSEMILKNKGALLSEYAPLFEATPWSFPKRNRIMAGMSHAILIIEATERSGTLITARLAIEYNREVLAVPGSIFSQGSFGAHTLIRHGATPITTSEDILEALQIQKEHSRKRPTYTLSETQKKVLTILSTAPITKDDLIRALNMPTNDAQVLLSTMELQDMISEIGGLVYPKIELKNIT